jgi:hypothetical protein
MMTHSTPAARNAGPNLLKISKSALQNLRPAGSGPRTKAVKCMGKENAGAHQAQKRCNCLDHRKCPLRPARTERLPRCTVKRISWENRKSKLTDVLAQQMGREASQSVGTRRGLRLQLKPAIPQIDGAPPQPLSNHPAALPISAAFGMRYPHSLVRWWAGSDVVLPCARSRHAGGGMVIGADGDSTVISICADGAKRCHRGGMPRSRQLRLVGQVRQPGRPQIRRFQ